MKSLFAKTDKSICAKWRYLRLKVKKNKENNKKMFASFDHNFKNVPLYVVTNISFKMYYFVLYDRDCTSKSQKMDLSVFVNKLLKY